MNKKLPTVKELQAYADFIIEYSEEYARVLDKIGFYFSKDANIINSSDTTCEIKKELFNVAVCIKKCAAFHNCKGVKDCEQYFIDFIKDQNE